MLPEKILKSIETRTGMKRSEVFGPFAFLDGKIFEIVVKKGQRTSDAYVFVNGEAHEPFDNVESLSIFTQQRYESMKDRLERKIDALEREAENTKTRKTPFNEKRFVLFSGMTLIMFCLGSIFYAYFVAKPNNPEIQSAFIYVVIGVVSSVITLMFGKWVAPKLPVLNKLLQS